MSDEAPTPGVPFSDPAHQSAVQAERLKDMRDRQRRFLRAYRISPQILPACRAAKLSSSLVYKWRADDKEFAAAMEEAHAEAVQRMEREAVLRATKGRASIVLYQGEPVRDPRKPHDDPDPWLYEYKWSDALLLKLLATHDPKYRDTSKLEVGGTGAPISLNIDADTRQAIGEMLTDPTVRDKVIGIGERLAKGESHAPQSP